MNIDQWTDPWAGEPLRGEKNGRARLNEPLVREIRVKYARGSVTLMGLAADYGMSYNAIWKAVNKKTWAHIR